MVVTESTPTPAVQPAPRSRPAPPVLEPANGGPTTMTVFGVIMFAAGWITIGLSGGQLTTAIGGLMLAVVGGLLWVGGRVNARINAWGRYNRSRP